MKFKNIYIFDYQENEKTSHRLEEYLQKPSIQAGEVAQMVECLSSKCETLSSNSSTAKRKKKTRLESKIYKELKK
jgi:hypothetical protein